MVKLYYIFLLLNLVLLPETIAVFAESNESITEDTLVEKTPTSFQDYLRQSETREGVRGKKQKRTETDFTKREPFDRIADKQRGDAEIAKRMEEFRAKRIRTINALKRGLTPQDQKELDKVYETGDPAKIDAFIKKLEAKEAKIKDLPDKLIALGIILTGFFCFVLFLSIRDSFKKPKK